MWLYFRITTATILVSSLYKMTRNGHKNKWNVGAFFGECRPRFIGLGNL